MADTPYPIPRQDRQSDIFVGDGGKIYGPFDFRIFNEIDVEVWTMASGETVFSPQPSVLVTKLSGAALDDFTIAFPANQPPATKIVVRSARLDERAAGVLKGVRVNPDALEREFSKISTEVQELRRDISRTVMADFGQDVLTIDQGLVDGDTLMKLGRRLVKGANAADIAQAQGYAAQAGQSAAQADAAAAAAIDAVLTAVHTQFATIAAASAYRPAFAPDFIRTAGYHASGDGGGALYKRVAVEPVHTGKLSITLAGGGSPVWYEIAEPVIDPLMLGARFDGVTNDGVAIQNALNIGKDVRFPAGATVIGDTVLRPRSGQTIRGIKGSTVIKKTTTGVVQYSKPFFDVLDVKDAVFEGLTLDFDKAAANELAFHLRATNPGDTRRVTIRACELLNCWIWVERYLRDTKILYNFIDGEGTAYAGIATGGRFINGAHDPANNKPVYGGGPQDFLVVEGNFICNLLQEGVDLNWFDQDVIIKNNFLVDCNLDAADVGQSAIDVGSDDTADTDVSARVTVEGNIIYFTSPQNSGGIEVKRDLNYCRVSGNIMANGASSGSKCTGIIVTNVNDVIVTDNIVIGFANGVTMVNDAGAAGGIITKNILRSPGSAGIILDVVSEAQVEGNHVFGVSTTQYGIQVGASVNTSNRNSIRGNKVRGPIAVTGIWAATTCYDAIIADNDVHGMTNAGYLLQGQKSVISGNKATSNGGIGFNIGNDYNIVTGNHAGDNGGPGFQIAGSTDALVLTSNMSMDSRSGGARTQTYGFFFNGASSNVMAIGNIGTNNTIANSSGTGALVSSTISPNSW